MFRTLAFGLAALALSHGVADAQGARQDHSGQAVLTQPSHNAKVNKVDALTLKQKQADPSAYNPKELTVDKPVHWNKKPKTTPLCAPPGGGQPRPC